MNLVDVFFFCFIEMLREFYCFYCCECIIYIIEKKNKIEYLIMGFFDYFMIVLLMFCWLFYFYEGLGIRI